jgi:hypothetical protein
MDLRELAKGLLTLEINTVRKDGMSAQKMPTAPHAIVEVAQVYWDFLCRNATDFGLTGTSLPSWSRKLSRSFRWAREPFPQPDEDDVRTVDNPGNEPPPAGYAPTFLANPPTAVTVEVLDHLREIAAWMAEMQLRTKAVAEGRANAFSDIRAQLTEPELADARSAARYFRQEERAIFQRIRRNCDQLKELAAKHPAGISRATPCEGFETADLVFIRKVWDIGVEVVLLQTVIQIDGDVVNRFQSGMDDPAKAQLHALHASAVDLSFKYWRWMIDALGRIAGETVSSLFGRI